MKRCYPSGSVVLVAGLGKFPPVVWGDENRKDEKWRFGSDDFLGGDNSKIFYFHPENWGR